MESERPLRHSVDTVSERKTPTVLIADDDQDLVRAMSNRIMHLGYRTTVASDALSALVLIKRDRPDLVVLDIHMPSGNGMCVLEMIRSEPEWSSIPVIVISGAATASMIQRVHCDNAYFVPKSEGMWAKVRERIEDVFCREPTSPSLKPHRPKPKSSRNLQEA